MPFPIKDFPAAAEIARWKAEDDLYRTYTGELRFTDKLSKRGLWRLKEFFENDEDKAKILNVALNLASVVVDSGTDFLFGEPVKIEVDAEGKEELQKAIDELVKRLDLRRKLKESCSIFQSVGHTQFQVYAVQEGGKRKAKIEEIPYDNWSPNWAGVPFSEESKDVRIVTYITQVAEDGTESKYIYVQNYYLEAGKAKCHKSLWDDNMGKLGDPKPLSLAGITAVGQTDPKNKLAVIEDTQLDEIPVVTAHVRKTVKDRHGHSVLEKVLPLLYEINDRLTQLSIQFLKHLNSKLQIPEGSVVRNADGTVKSVELEVLIARAGDPDAKYITNENPLIEQLFDHIKGLIRSVAKHTQTPDSFLLEDEKGGVEKAEALRTRLMHFLKRIRNYETTYDPLIEKLLRLCLKIEQTKGAEDVPLVFTFDPGLPKDWQADVTVWGDALAQKIASKETAVGMFQGIEGDELKKELERIDSDEDAAMQSQLDLMDAEAKANPPPGE